MFDNTILLRGHIKSKKNVKNYHIKLFYVHIATICLVADYILISLKHREKGL